MALETTVTVAKLAARLGKKEDDPEVAHAFNTAVELLTDATGEAFREIPPHVADDMVYRVGRAVYDGKKTEGGGQLTTVQGEGQRPQPRDPLATVGPELSRYVLGMA